MHKNFPIMLALCSMLLANYHAPNYVGIIGTGLVHNINHSKALYPYCAQDTIMEMHSRDITLIIGLLHSRGITLLVVLL